MRFYFAVDCLRSHDWGPVMTYQEIAKALGVSHQAVWETERKALAKVKAKLEARGLTLEDFLNALGGCHA